MVCAAGRRGMMACVPGTSRDRDAAKGTAPGGIPGFHGQSSTPRAETSRRRVPGRVPGLPLTWRWRAEGEQTRRPIRSREAPEAPSVSISSVTAAPWPGLVLVREGGRRTQFSPTPTLLPRSILRSVAWSNAPAQINFCAPQADVAPTPRRTHGQYAWRVALR